MANKRPRVRASNENFVAKLYTPQIDGVCRVVKMVSHGAGQRKVDAGRWQSFTDSDGSVAYRVREIDDRDLKPSQTRGEITAREMRINALGRSVTVGLSETRRAERAAVGRPPEDLVERVRGKVAAHESPASKPREELKRRLKTAQRKDELLVFTPSGCKLVPVISRGDRAVRVYPKVNVKAERG